MSSYPEYSVSQLGSHYKFHSISQSYNPKVADPPRPRLPDENPKDYVLATYTSVELVADINAATKIYRLDPFVKYVCAWLVQATPEEYQALYSRTQWKHPNLISFLFLDQNQQIIRVFYEYLQLDVRTLITRRQQTQSYFPEQELFKCLQGLSSAMSFLEKRSIHHGAISLDSIYFDEEYLLYRIQDVSPFRAKAPHLFKNQYAASENQQGANPFKQDVFSLGIFALSMMLLRDCGQLFIQGVLDQVLLSKFIEEAQVIYSPKLCSVIQKMLELNASLRVDWTSLIQLIDEVQKPQQPQPNVQNQHKAPPQTRQASSQRGRPSFKEDMISPIMENKSIENRRNTEARSKNDSTQKPKGSKIDQKLLQLTSKIQETLAKSQNTQLRS